MRRGKKKLKSAEVESKLETLFDVKTKLKIEAPEKCSVTNLAAAGPVYVIHSKTGGRGLLVHHGAGPDFVALTSLTTGGGFTLSRAAALELGTRLVEFGKADSATSAWVGETWSLAK